MLHVQTLEEKKLNDEVKKRKQSQTNFQCWFVLEQFGLVLPRGAADSVRETQVIGGGGGGGEGG